MKEQTGDSGEKTSATPARDEATSATHDDGPLMTHDERASVTHDEAASATHDEGLLVTVVVPSYNHAPFVERALRSVFRQTLAPARLIVIDDGSTDGSPRIIESALAGSPIPCEFIARPNRGLCATLNEALALSSTRYFAYLGSDDLWLPGFLEARLALLEARPRAALAYGHCLLVDESDDVIDCTADWASYADGDARSMLMSTTAPMSPTVVHRREALARYGWREGARLEDFELYLRLSKDHEFAFDPRPLSAWRLHGENTSRDQQLMLEEQLAALERTLPGLGITPGEMERLKMRISFSRAEDFLRLGDKRGALRLLRASLPGGASARSLARVIFRLALPYSLFRLRKRSTRRRAAARYGPLDSTG